MLDVDVIEARVIRKLFGDSARVSGVLFYGSRTRAGAARPGSDYDLTVVVEGGRSGFAEFHGEVEWGGARRPLELRAGDLASLKEEMQASGPARAFALKGALPLGDRKGHAARLLAAAHQEFEARKIGSLRELEDLDPGALRNLISLTTRETRSVIHATPSAFARAARLAEFTCDFIAYTEYLAAKLGRKADLGMAVLFSAARPARLLASHPLLAELDVKGADPFRAMGRYFERKTGKSLELDNPKHSPEAWIYPKES